MKSQNSKRLEILIEESRNGNKEAFRKIFEELNNRLFFYALSHTKNRDDALDVTQDTFIEVWNGLRKFQYYSNEAFYGFIFTILKRKLSKHYKKKNTEGFTDEKARLNDEVGQVVEESYEMETEDYRFLLKHVDKLTKKYQDVLKLRYWSDLTFKEISSALEIRETTAKVRHHRALQELKVKLSPFEKGL